MKFKKRLGEKPLVPEKAIYTEHRTKVYSWTRKEQVDNAYKDGTEDEMKPPLKAKERRP